MKSKTLFVSAAAALILGAGAITGARAQSSAPTVTVDHDPVEFTGQTPIEQDGSILVPLRGVLEKLGAYVDYDAATQTVTAVREGTKIRLPIGSRHAMVNGMPVSLGAPAQTVHGSTMVPLRFVAESLGARVVYDAAHNNVAIFSHEGRPGMRPRRDGGPRDGGPPRDGGNRPRPDRPGGDPPAGGRPSDGGFAPRPGDHTDPGH